MGDYCFTLVKDFYWEFQTKECRTKYLTGQRPRTLVNDLCNKIRTNNSIPMMFVLTTIGWVLIERLYSGIKISIFCDRVKLTKLISTQK